MKIRGLAHRGYSKKYVENTLKSFQAAVDLSYTHLELDVQLSKDEVPVVIHDLTVDRITDGTGRVKDYTVAELKQLKVAGGEQIPTLEEALDLLRDRIIIDIELKQMGDLYPGLEKIVVDTLIRKNMQEQAFITSFDHYAIEKVRQLNDNIEIGLINSGASPALFPFVKEIGARYLSIDYRYVTDTLINLCEQQGVNLIPWTVNLEEDMNRFAAIPSLIVCTDELEAWARIYSSHR